MSKFRKQHMDINWYEIIGNDTTSPIINASLSEKASLVGRVGLMMLSVGTAAWRVRASMNKIARALNISCTADIGLLSIEYTCTGDGEVCTNALSLRTTGVNTHKLSCLENFADNFADRTKKYSAEQFHRILDKIDSLQMNYKAWKLGLAAAFACCAFTFLLGGGITEMICAFFGAGVGNFIRKKLLENHITLLANVTTGVASACCTYVILIKLAELLFNISAAHQAGYICSLLFVIPGYPLITGGFDLAKMDLRSGLERVTYAMLIIVPAALTGWITASLFGFAPGEFTDVSLPLPLTIILRLIMSFIGVYGFSLMFNSTRKMAFTAGIIGMLANTLRLELIDFTSIHPAAAAFIGTLTAGLLATAVKPVIGCPRITLTVPSVVIMVPGMFLYKGVFFIAQNDISQGGLWLTKAILIIISLPLGLIFARILTDKNFRKSS